MLQLITEPLIGPSIVIQQGRNGGDISNACHCTSKLNSTIQLGANSWLKVCKTSMSSQWSKLHMPKSLMISVRNMLKTTIMNWLRRHQVNVNKQCWHYVKIPKKPKKN